MTHPARQVASRDGSSAISLGTAEAYDPVTNVWTTWAPMPTGRESFALQELAGALYAVGGYSLRSGHLASVEVVQP